MSVTEPATTGKTLRLPMSVKDIMDILPHRYPFILVDRVTECEPQKSIKGYKNVSVNEPFFQGHFPGDPIMPWLSWVWSC